MISGCHCRDYVYSGLSISTRRSSAPLTLSLTCPTPRLSVLVSASWCAEHSGYTRHNRHSCSTSRRRAWPEPPSHSCDVCPGSFHLWTEDREVGREIKLRNTLKYCLISYTHRPETCGPQGIVLQVCSCTGLVFKSQSWLCFLSFVRQRASLICKPFPQEREHWGSKAGEF